MSLALDLYTPFSNQKITGGRRELGENKTRNTDKQLSRNGEEI